MLCKRLGVDNSNKKTKQNKMIMNKTKTVMKVE